MTVLSPAELRAAIRLMGIYSYAAEHLVAEEQAAEAASVPAGAAMVANRFADLTATAEVRASFSAYLDRLERTHGEDKSLRGYIAEGRAAIAAAEAPSPTPHLEVA